MTILATTMANEIITHTEMCAREGRNLQRGMHYSSPLGYSVLLMSRRRNAPYNDRLEDDGATLIYEGHDVARSSGVEDPKVVDQPEKYPSGAPTENGRFYQAAIDFARRRGSPRRVRVYEKIQQGIWSYNGFFHLTDAWRESDGQRQVFKFRLAIADEDEGEFLTDLPNGPLIVLGSFQHA